MTTSKDQRREQILQAGLDVLAEKGWQGCSMIAVARAANASKETLYNWFGDKEGFFAALIRQNARRMDAALPGDFAGLAPRDGLEAFGRELLRLLTSDASVALNRAAIADAGRADALGRILIAEGREKSLPKLAAWLAAQARTGALHCPDPARAADRFIALVKGDLQLEVLLGVAAAPDTDEISRIVKAAVAEFLTLYAPRAVSP